MEFAKLARTGVAVSRLCIGTGTFGKQPEETEAHRILDKAAEAGLNFIDTADLYPPGVSLGSGASEIIVGRWLADKRGQFFLGAKGGGPIGHAPWDKGNSRKHLLDAIEGSLRRLKTEYVDLYSLHLDDPETPLEETVEAMDAIVRSGKTRYIGVSNLLAYRLARALGMQDARSLARFVCIQPRYNLLFREVERELFPLVREESIAVTPYNPLAGGFLSGKYRMEDSPQKGRFSTEYGGVGEKYSGWYWDDRKFKTVGKIQEIANQRNVPITTLCIAWLMANPLVTSVIIGPSRVEHLTDLLAAAEYKLDSEVKAKLDELSIEYRRGDTENEQPQTNASVMPAGAPAT
jgi:aryl-alcohol dehydrogenase-like predicted oxidoreductase